jgi:hypothetical protein
MRHHEHTTLRHNDAHRESALEPAATTMLHQDFDGACQNLSDTKETEQPRLFVQMRRHGG